MHSLGITLGGWRLGIMGLNLTPVIDGSVKQTSHFTFSPIYPVLRYCTCSRVETWALSSAS